jgi:hypothetical protein
MNVFDDTRIKEQEYAGLVRDLKAVARLLRAG